MNPLLTLETTIRKIELENLPFWDLSYYTHGYYDMYQCGRFNEADLERSVAQLRATVLAFQNKEQVKFHIKARPTTTSSKGTVLEWDFTVTDNFQSPNPQQNLNNQFSGFGNIDYQEIKSKQEKLEDLKDTLRNKEMDLKLKEFQLQTRIERFNELEKETRAELTELQKKYESSTDAAKNGFSLILADLLKNFNTNAKGKGLAGLLAPPPGEEVQSPEDQEIEKIALNIQSHKLPVPEIKNLGDFIDRMLKSKNQSMSGTKNKVFTYTLYRIPTDEELKPFNDHPEMTPEEIFSEFLYIMVGKGILNNEHKQQILEGINKLCSLYPEVPRFKEAINYATNYFTTHGVP